MTIRTTLALAATLTLATVSLHADSITLTPDDVWITVGESVTLSAEHHMSGLTGLPGEATFETDDPRIATASGQLSWTTSSGGAGTASATGIAIGTARVDAGPRYPLLATIHVYDPFAPILPYPGAVTANRGDSVPLEVIGTFPPDTQLLWFHGRIGDTSEPIDPLPGDATKVRFVDHFSGRTFVWVEALSSRSVRAAEFMIDVPPDAPRRRAIVR